MLVNKIKKKKKKKKNIPLYVNIMRKKNKIQKRTDNQYQLM